MLNNCLVSDMLYLLFCCMVVLKADKIQPLRSSVIFLNFFMFVCLFVCLLFKCSKEKEQNQQRDKKTLKSFQANNKERARANNKLIDKNKGKVNFFILLI